MPTLVAGESSYHSPRQGEDEHGGGLPPCRLPGQGLAVGDSAFGGGAGGAGISLPTPLAGSIGHSITRYSSPKLQTGAGEDWEVLVPPAAGVVGAAVLVRAPPRLVRVRVASDGSLFESNAPMRRPKIGRRNRRTQDRPQGQGGVLVGGAATDSSMCGDNRRRDPTARADSSDDNDDNDDDDKGTSDAPGLAPPQSLRGRGTCGTTPGCPVQDPTDAAHAEGLPVRDPPPPEEEEKEAGARRRRTWVPDPTANRLPMRSGSFGQSLVAALQDFHQPGGAEGERERQRQRQRQQKGGQRGRPGAAAPAQSSGGGRGVKKRSGYLGNRGWSRARSFGAGVGGGGGSGASSRRGSGTGGGGSNRGSEIFGKVKSILSIDPRRPRGPAVPQMTRSVSLIVGLNSGSAPLRGLPACVFESLRGAKMTPFGTPP